MLLRFIGLKSETISGFLTPEDKIEAEYHFKPLGIYEVRPEHGQFLLTKYPDLFEKVEDSPPQEKIISGGDEKGLLLESSAPGLPCPSGPADPPREVKGKEAERKHEKSRGLKTSLRRKERKKLCDAVDFLSWLYEHCEGGNINFRFLGGKFPQNEFVPLSSLNEKPSLIDAVLRDYHSLNSYFGAATRDKTDGSKEGILQVPALWVDLDGAPLEKVMEGPWSPSAVVETSPKKYHVYWKLREPADRSEIPLVEDLLRRLASFFKADPAATDASRILRIPGTSNLKTNPPHSVQVVIKGQEEWNLWDFDDLPEIEGTTGFQLTGGVERKNERLKKILECRFLQHCDKDRATLSEPEWFAMIGILARETGGPMLIHQLSRGYPKYSSRETDAKILHSMNGPPMTCSTIKQLWNCGQDCGVKSPAALAFKKSPDISSHPPVNDFPREAIGGLTGEFAQLYSSYLEVPAQFFFVAFLTCLGHLLADQITLASEIAPQPRLYTILLGESADDRKSTGISKTVDFFRGAVQGFSVCWGIGSAEGLQKRLEENSRLILCFDEFKGFVNKCKIEASVLLPCVNTLFESNRYESRTKTSHVYLENAYLSLLAASTIQTYENTWSSQFTDIGFNNRLFLVPGSGERRFSVPAKVPESEKNLIKLRLKELLQHASKYPELTFSEGAKRIFHDWYMGLDRGIHTKRLDTYALRLMPLLAINSLKPKVDEETVQKILMLCNWQLEIRRLHDPIDADNEVARMEEKIRRVLIARGPLTNRELRQYTNTRKEGICCFKRPFKIFSKFQISLF